MLTNQTATRGQLERALSQRIQALYREQLGQNPDKVTCQFFDEKLAIVVENVLTASEQVLISTDQQESAEQLRLRLDALIKPQIISAIEEVSGVHVNTLLIDRDSAWNVCGMIAILQESPNVRDPQSIPKLKKKDEG